MHQPPYGNPDGGWGGAVAEPRSAYAPSTKPTPCGPDNAEGLNQPDPHIFVEPAPFESGAGADPAWARGRDAVQRPPVVVPGQCPHRVRWRDLKAASRAVFVLVAVLVFTSLLEAAFGLLFGGVMLAAGIDMSELSMVVLGPAIVVMAAMLLVGFLACAGAWRRLHEPGRFGCVLSTIASPLVLVFLGLWAIGSGWPWLMLFVAPPVAPMIVLWWFRSATYSRETCASYPWLPPRLAALRRS